MKIKLISTFAALISIYSITSFAHHGSNGQFDQAKELTVSGVVTDIKFVNPHSYVYFDVTNDDGSVDAWRCELRAGSLMKRTGWSTEMFKDGTKIKVFGSPARREPHGCYTRTITFEDGTVVARNDVLNETAPAATPAATTVAAATSAVTSKLNGGIPDLSGNWVAPPRQRGGNAAAMGAAAAMGDGMAAAGGMAAGGMAAGMGARPSRYTLTKAGEEASAGHERENNPRFQCKATNIFHDWTFDQHVNKIEQTNDKITLTYGFMDLVRTIHLDIDAHPEDIVPSVGGHSIGSWDGDTLVVDTVGFKTGYLDGTFTGTKHSDEMHTIEKYSLSEDGKTLTRSYTLEDKKYLEKPYSSEDTIGRTTAAFDPYECEDLTEEIVDGF